MSNAIEHAHRVYDAALRGDFREIDGAIESLSGAVLADAKAWSIALSALASTIDPERPVADIRELAAMALGDSGRRAASRATGHVTLRAVLAFDPAALAQCMTVQQSLRGAGDDPELELQSRATRLWELHLRGGSPPAAGEAAELASLATRAGVAPLVIDATVLRALFALEAGDVEGGVAAARRSSLMARSEGMLQQEYLANLALARARKHSAKPHLAARILGGLAQVVPVTWGRWLDWEWALATDATSAGPPGSERLAMRATRAVVALLDAASRGDRDVFESRSEWLLDHTSGWRALRRDAELVIAALDPVALLDRAGEGASWCVGTSHAMPLALGDLDDAAPAYVLALPGRAARRLLAPGFGLLERSVARAAVRLGGRSRKDARVLVALAVLALRGEAGLADEELFQSVYGFRYVPLKHEGVFRVLLHRARALLAEAGEIRRHDGGIVLVPHRPLLLPDPRCAQALDDRVLQVLARTASGRATAQDAAHALGLSVRAVQAVLARLVSEGLCAAERAGRSVSYRVEDTTFQEPTYTRLRGRQPEAS